MRKLNCLPGYTHGNPALNYFHSISSQKFGKENLIEILIRGNFSSGPGLFVTRTSRKFLLTVMSFVRSVFDDRKNGKRISRAEMVYLCFFKTAIQFNKNDSVQNFVLDSWRADHGERPSFNLILYFIYDTLIYRDC